MLVPPPPRPAAEFELPDPPHSVVAWVTLLGLIAVCASGGVWVGKLTTRVEVLESFSPISVDRRLGAIEAQSVQIKEQVTEIKQLLQAQERRGTADDMWGARPR